MNKINLAADLREVRDCIYKAERRLERIPDEERSMSDSELLDQLDRQKAKLTRIINTLNNPGVSK